MLIRDPPLLLFQCPSPCLAHRSPHKGQGAPRPERRGRMRCAVDSWAATEVLIPCWLQLGPNAGCLMRCTSTCTSGRRLAIPAGCLIMRVGARFLSPTLDQRINADGVLPAGLCAHFAPMTSRNTAKRGKELRIISQRGTAQPITLFSQDQRVAVTASKPLITQRSLVQIQPPQPSQGRGVSGQRRSPLLLHCTRFAPAAPRQRILPHEPPASTNVDIPYIAGSRLFAANAKIRSR